MKSILRFLLALAVGTGSIFVIGVLVSIVLILIGPMIINSGEKGFLILRVLTYLGLDSVIAIMTIITLHTIGTKVLQQIKGSN